jgi:hypothetical protein
VGNKIADSAGESNIAYSSLLRTQASVLTQSLSMTHILDEVAKGHMNVASAATVLIPHLLRMSAGIYRIIDAYGDKIAAQTVSIAGDVKEAAVAMAHAVAEGVRQAALWLTTAATKAYAIAQAIADSLSPEGWLVLAGAAAAAAVGVGLAMTIPSKAEGGPITQTGPIIAHAGEYVLKAGAWPIIAGPGKSEATINNYVTIQDPVFRSRSDLDYLVGRLKRMGMA